MCKALTEVPLVAQKQKIMKRERSPSTGDHSTSEGVNASALESVVTGGRTAEGLPPVEAPAYSAPTHPAGDDCVPVAAIIATDTTPEGEAVNGLLREPNRPKEIFSVTATGVPVPNVPMDLLELLVS